MSARAVILICAVTTLLECGCEAPLPRTVPRSPERTDFEAAIARIERRDSGSPAELNARLAYADFLINQASGPCGERLVRAQEQLGRVEASPQAPVLFSGGSAHTADLEYRLHLASSECGSGTDRASELRSASEAARRAVERYRNEFDYHSMVIMQFDASVVLHQLGDDAAALAALKTALDMDREYGFSQDARENYQLLLTWEGRPAGAAQVAELMQDFPQRQVRLKFDWRASDAQVTLEDDRESLTGTQLLRSHAEASVERRIEAGEGGNWTVSYTHHQGKYRPGIWPVTESPQTLQSVFTPAAVPAVDFKVGAMGEFDGVTNAKAAATKLTAETDRLIESGAPAGEAALKLTVEAIATTAEALSPGMLEAEAAQNYQLETAMWIGAILDQGVWYEVSAPLSLPGMPAIVLQNQIEFAFTRMVPCTAGSRVQSCIEIVLRATPDKAALARLTADFSNSAPYSRFTDFTASTVARIVTDATTLLPYGREERISWYASPGKGRGESILQSEHVVSTSRYGVN